MEIPTPIFKSLFIKEDYMNKYICSRCGKEFEIKHEVEGDAMCTPCFKGLLKVKSSEEYYNYRKRI